MEPAFANHPTGLLIANPGLPYEPLLDYCPPSSYWLVRPLTPRPSARSHSFTGLFVARPPLLTHF